jgi:hypothetical protein
VSKSRSDGNAFPTIASHPGVDLVVNRHPSHIGLAGNRLYREVGIAIGEHEQFTSGAEDASAFLFDGYLALAEAVRARSHMVYCDRFVIDM